MFIIYSEPEFVGRDSCYKLLPQHFFVNFQIKSIKLCNELKVAATNLTEPKFSETDPKKNSLERFHKGRVKVSYSFRKGPVIRQVQKIPIG